MCKPGKSFNTGVKTSYLSSHKDALQKKQPCRRGSALYRRSDWTSRLWAMSKVGLFKTTRERRALRSCALQRAPVRWTLTSEPTIGRSLRPCQSRKIMEQRIQRLQSRELSRWRHAAEVPEGAWTDHVTPKQRTELTRENEAKASSLLQQQTASNKPNIPNSD